MVCFYIGRKPCQSAILTITSEKDTNTDEEDNNLVDADSNNVYEDDGGVSDVEMLAESDDESSNNDSSTGESSKDESSNKDLPDIEIGMFVIVKLLNSQNFSLLKSLIGKTMN